MENQFLAETYGMNIVSENIELERFKVTIAELEGDIVMSFRWNYKNVGVWVKPEHISDVEKIFSYIGFGDWDTNNYYGDEIDSEFDGNYPNVYRNVYWGGEHHINDDFKYSIGNLYEYETVTLLSFLSSLFPEMSLLVLESSGSEQDGSLDGEWYKYDARSMRVTHRERHRQMYLQDREIDTHETKDFELKKPNHIPQDFINLLLKYSTEDGNTGLSAQLLELINSIKGPSSVIIPNGTTRIKDEEFYGKSNLKEIIIPDSVTSIGEYAFSDCSSLTMITIPNSVASIGDYAFSGCSGLAMISIPNSVTSIGKGVFSGCSNLTTITIPNSVTSIGTEAFYMCSSLMAIAIPDSVTSIGAKAFSNCKSLTSVTISKGITCIEYGTFKACSSLTSINIPINVREIKQRNFDVRIWGAFNGCTALTEINLADGLVYIDKYAFASCDNIKTAVITENLAQREDIIKSLPAKLKFKIGPDDLKPKTRKKLLDEIEKMKETNGEAMHAEDGTQTAAVPCAEGEAQFSNGNHDGATKAFTDAEKCRDAETQLKEAQYQKALLLTKSGDYAGAYTIYAALAGYKDVDTIVERDKNISAAAHAAFVSKLQVGNTVTFGNYCGEAIKWVVLAEEGDKRVMITVKGQDAVCFNTSKKNSNEREKSYVRTWLNGTFYKKAFSRKEKAIITAGPTNDNVWLLSVDEANQYFASDDDRICYPTQIAKQNGAYTNDSGACWWWLRSPGSFSCNAAYVYSNGNVYSDGRNIYGTYACVRPVVMVLLS